MKKRIDPSLWKPKDIKSLEANAEKAIKKIEKNIIVTAGPGSGKTELLAQKACYLLETNQCKSPKRILAISFKRDAAKNIKDRVELRVGKDLAKRFDSFTFDAFATNILSRFRKGLPEIFRPSKDYEIDFTLSNRNIMRELIFSFQEENGLTGYDLSTLNPSSFEREYLCKNKLTLDGISIKTTGGLVSKLIWHKKLHNGNSSSQLSFNMISRLSEFILRLNPIVLNSLRQTYAYVFLDEFQDTTQIQYDLLKTCFKGSKSNLTAVGDSKQRIMSWAGALENIFDIFAYDFQAERIYLHSNYRSAPRLVEIQHAIIKELEGEYTLLPVPTNTSYKKEEGVCSVFEYDTEEIEAHHLTNMIIKLMIEEKVSPREICILTRKTPETYTSKLIGKLYLEGIEARIENEFQDLLAEPLIILILNLLKLIAFKRNPTAWEEVLTYLLNSEINYDDTYKKSSEIEIKLENFIKKSKENIQSQLQIDTLLKEIVNFLDLNKIKAAFPQYKRDKYWKDLCNKLYDRLNEYLSGSDLKEAIRKLEGENAIPIMTMHKSKGLEFYAVFFIGLEDSSLWGYKKNPLEETNGFFVAFSRAKKCMYFTYCHNRNGYRQSYLEIKKLYDLLNISGVAIYKINKDF